MSLVLVKKNPKGNNVGDEAYQNLINALPKIVAEGLNTLFESPLTPEEVSVWDGEAPLPDYSIGRRDVEIIILPNNFEGRMDNLDERREWITDACRPFLPAGTTYSVRVFCMLSSLGDAVA